MEIDVIDLKLKALNFSKQYTHSRRMRARTIYYYENVEIQKVNQIDPNTYVITAKVIGTNADYYDVMLKIHNEYVQEQSCTCEDFEKGNLCKHILATSMEIIEPNNPSTEEGRIRLIEKRQKEEQERRKEYLLRQEEARKKREYQLKYSKALTAIGKFKKANGIEQEDNFASDNINVKEMYEKTKAEKLIENKGNTNLCTNINLEPKVEFGRTNELYISFKIGQNKMYSLKNIEEFCRAFEKEECIQFGKNLRFVAKTENFDTKSQMLLKLILNYGKILKYNEKLNERYYYGRLLEKSKNINIIDDTIDDFFDAIGDQNIIIFTNNEGNELYKITNKEINISLEMTNFEDDSYKLNINLDDYRYVTTKKNLYIFYKNEIYKIKKNKNIENVLEIFISNSEILIPKNKIEEFNKYVYPQISRYIEKDKLPVEIVKEGIIPENLASKIYLDLDEKNNITLELKFCYQNYEFNILDKNYKKYLAENNIVRNVLEEKKVLKRLFYDGFELANNKKYFILKEQDETFEFLSEKITSYMNDFEVLATDKFKSKRVRSTNISNVSVKLENGLLELDISKIDIDIDEIKEVLKNYNIKKKYYKLKNGDYLNLEENENIDFLNEIQNNLDVSYDKVEKGIIKVPVNRSIYLEKILEKNRNINASKNDDFTKLINNIENKNFSDNFKVDKRFEKILRDYQKTGYKWLKVLDYYKFGGILADDMGLGKTLQIIALIASELKSKNKKTSIVVCPSSLVLNWKVEIEKWCKDIKVLSINGDAKARKELISSCEKYDLVITSYDLLKRDILEYEDKNFRYIIADEAQYIKNFTTQNATALKNLNGETKFALTGTPIENSVSELWSIFDFIMPGYLYNYGKFKKRFEIPILKENDEEALKKLKLMITPFILRRIKADVLTELPEKNISIMQSEMTKEQEKLYISYFMQTKKELAQELSTSTFEKSKFKILMLLTRLRQICCHPSLFINNYEGESGKLNQCMDIINEAIASNHKILLFSGYTSMFEIIEEKLNKENIKYYKLTGSTPVDKRVEMVEKFNKDESIKIFLISLKAGGTGLNLTGADVVIHYDPWWNVSIENQATDRAYRIGQKNSVQVYKLITTNSIEEKISKLQEKKARIAQQLLSTEEKFINKLSKEEIMELFE